MAKIQYFTRSTIKGKFVDLRIRFRDGRNIDLLADSGLKVKTDHWSNKTQTVKNIVEATYKDSINTEIRKLNDFILTSIPKGEAPTRDWLVTTIDKFHNPEKYTNKHNTLFSYIENFILKAPTRTNHKTGRPVCYKMIREYERTFYYLKGFANKKNRTIDFKDVDLDFYHDFINYLESLNLALNTIGKKVQTLKIFLNAASDEGINHNMNFKSHRFAVLSEESDHIYLNKEEIKKIYELDLSKIKFLEKARDWFIINCWTGLRYGDWHKVNNKNINEGFLEIKQGKTKNSVVIPLHDDVIKIIAKYDGNLPGVISDQNMRDYIKVVAKRAGITEEVEKSMTKGGLRLTIKRKKWDMVGTHTCRRSFATNMYKQGVPSLTIMAITGHKTEASFLKYIKVTPREHAEKMRELWSRQAMKLVNG